MSTSLELNGNRTNAVTSFSVRENSTPVNSGDNSGGSGSMTIAFADYDDASLLTLKPITLRDSKHGIVGGRVSNVGGDTFEATLEADTRLSALVNFVKAAPYVGTLGGALDYYNSIANVPDDILVDPVLAAKPVAYPGWRGLYYDKLKELAILHRMEIALVSNQIVARPVRQRIAETTGRADFEWKVDTTELYDSFSVAQYNHRAITDEVVYPAMAAGRVSTISMEANEDVEVRLSLDASLSSIEQPQITQYFNEFQAPDISAYAVTDNAGVTLTALEWSQLGGKVWAEIDPEDDTVVVVHAKGGSDDRRAPYKLQMPRSGRGVDAGAYPALSIVGTGVAFKREVYEIKTGVPSDLGQGREAGVIDTIFAANRGDAWHLASTAAISYSTPLRTVSATVEYTNRLGEDGIYKGATYEDFEDEYPTETYPQFEAEKGAETYEEFALDYLNRVVENFDNQAFGNVGGARIRFGDSFMRIRTATITNEDIRYLAEDDTTIEEFQAEWSNDETYGDFEAFWGDTTYTDFSLTPLRSIQSTSTAPSGT